jgi:four helix bundle protein
MRDHTKLKVFELADRLAIHIYRETISFPKAELYGLRSQIRRAAVSIPCNIVEGCARSTQAEYSRFLEVAYGSARELQYQIGLSARLGYLDEKSAKRLDDESTALAKALNGLVRALAR